MWFYWMRMNECANVDKGREYTLRYVSTLKIPKIVTSNVDAIPAKIKPEKNIFESCELVKELGECLRVELGRIHGV